MTKILGRASAVAFAALIAAAAPQAALAQKKGEKAPSFKFSKAVQPLLADAQKKQQAGDAVLPGFCRRVKRSAAGLIRCADKGDIGFERIFYQLWRSNFS